MNIVNKLESLIIENKFEKFVSLLNSHTKELRRNSFSLYKTATSYHRHNFIIALLQNGKVDPSTEDNALLHYAIRNDLEDIIQLLLKDRSVINISNCKHISDLIISKNNFELFKIFIQKDILFFSDPRMILDIFKEGMTEFKRSVWKMKEFQHFKNKSFILSIISTHGEIYMLNEFLENYYDYSIHKKEYLPMSIRNSYIDQNLDCLNILWKLEGAPESLMNYDPKYFKIIHKYFFNNVLSNF